MVETHLSNYSVSYNISDNIISWIWLSIITLCWVTQLIPIARKIFSYGKLASSPPQPSDQSKGGFLGLILHKWTGSHASGFALYYKFATLIALWVVIELILVLFFPMRDVNNSNILDHASMDHVDVLPQQVYHVLSKGINWNGILPLYTVLSWYSSNALTALPFYYHQQISSHPTLLTSGAELQAVYETKRDKDPWSHGQPQRLQEYATRHAPPVSWVACLDAAYRQMVSSDLSIGGSHSSIRSSSDSSNHDNTPALWFNFVPRLARTVGRLFTVIGHPVIVEPSAEGQVKTPGYPETIECKSDTFTWMIQMYSLSEYIETHATGEIYSPSWSILDTTAMDKIPPHYLQLIITHAQYAEYGNFISSHCSVALAWVVLVAILMHVTRRLFESYFTHVSSPTSKQSRQHIFVTISGLIYYALVVATPTSLSYLGSISPRHNPLSLITTALYVHFDELNPIGKKMLSRFGSDIINLPNLSWMDRFSFLLSSCCQGLMYTTQLAHLFAFHLAYLVYSVLGSPPPLHSAHLAHSAPLTADYLIPFQPEYHGGRYLSTLYLWVGICACILFLFASLMQLRCHEILANLRRSPHQPVLNHQQVEQPSLPPQKQRGKSSNPHRQNVPQAQPSNIQKQQEQEPIPTASPPAAAATAASSSSQPSGTASGAGTGYRIPHAGWFRYVTCPHYLAEIMIYCALALPFLCVIPSTFSFLPEDGVQVSGELLPDTIRHAIATVIGAIRSIAHFTPTITIVYYYLLPFLFHPLVLCVVWVISNLCITAQRTKQWYITTFKHHYPTTRAPVFPGGRTMLRMIVNPSNW